MRFPRLAFLTLLLLSAAAVGCKQDIGERCEQGSDCSSGYCDYSTGSMMTNAQGRVCTGALPPLVSMPEDAATDDQDANMTPADASGDVATPSSDAHGDVSTPDVVTPAIDGPSDATDATESDQGG
jgi:hypothetical protein